MESPVSSGILGVDVGGTFTDFYFFRDDGGVEVHKRPSSPANPADSILEGIRERGWRPREVVHGSTVATNTVLERSGARTAFIATKGFRDLLTIGRQDRPRIYDLEPSRPPPLVDHSLCFEVAERLDFRGEVLEALTSAEVRRVAAEIKLATPEAVAVCLLFSFRDGRHEALLGAPLREAGLDVSLSHEVLPEIREYERASTTVLSAYVGPKVRAYLRDLEARLGEPSEDDPHPDPLPSPGRGDNSPSRPDRARLSIVQSSGGTLTSGQAAALPASILLSGPAAGVAGAFAIAGAAGITNVITLDMGGTSTDVCLCPGRIPYTNEWEVTGLPVRLPAISIHTVGAGGGSIAWIDDGGALRVGPQSAGAAPGPAAYGRGGPATTTDAHLVLGRLAADSFLGGSFAVDTAAAESALRRLDLGSAATAAMGVITVANAIMERALRVVSVERGFDPVDFVLVAFGGAGPLHACELAEALRIHRILIPRYPGVLSAAGMAWADATRDFSTAVDLSLAPSADTAATEEFLRNELEKLEARARSEFSDAAEMEPAVDMRYSGQGYELTIPWPAPGIALLLEAFHDEHQQRYGHASRDRVAEMVTLRLRARVRRTLPMAAAGQKGSLDPITARAGARTVYLETQTSVPVFARERLRPGNVIPGPAIVGQMDSTTLVLPGWRATVDGAENLVLEMDP